jgi:hypothetical protein
MFVTLVEKMGVEEKESAMKDRDQEIGKEDEKGQGLDLEIEVSVSEVEDPGPEKESVDDQDQETRRKVEGAPDLAREIDVIGEIEIGKVEKEELKRAILISKKNLFGKTKSMSRKNQLKTWDTTLMTESMEIMMIQLPEKLRKNADMTKENHKS